MSNFTIDIHRRGMGQESEAPQAPATKFPILRGDPVPAKYIKRGCRQYLGQLFSRRVVYVVLVISTAYVLLTHASSFTTLLTISELPKLWFLSMLLGAVACYFYMKMPTPVYLVDFTTWKGPDELKTPHETFAELSKKSGYFTQESLDFQIRLLAKSEISSDAYFPPGIHKFPPDQSISAARQEAEMVMFSCVDELLKRTRIAPWQIDVLVVNCSLFCPTPSLSAMIIQHFKLKTDIKSFNLGGMGCSAGIISIDLAKDMLQLYKNSYALVVSTENITQNWYHGNDRAMLLQNTLFRMGGAAVLLSNHARDRSRAKFKLLHTVRTHRGSDPAAYSAVFQEQDTAGNMGVRLSKEIMAIAGDTLRLNITVLGPRVLPMGEQMRYVLNMVARKLLKQDLPGPIRGCAKRFTRTFLALRPLEDRTWTANAARKLRGYCSLETPSEQEKLGAILDKYPDGMYPGKTYTPDFKKAFDFFCIHAGGRQVIEAIKENLSLSKEDVAASKYTLNRFGNTSSSSVWYEMEYHLNNSALHNGSRVWQIAFGSGFKCNSAVWEAMNVCAPSPPTHL